MECINLTRFFMAISLILIYVIQKLVGLAHQASPTNLKPKFDDMDLKHLSFEDQLLFTDREDTIVHFPVFSFELNERQGCLGTGNYTVMRTFLAINLGQMVMRVRGFRMGSSPTGLAHDYSTNNNDDNNNNSNNNNNNNNKVTSSTTSADAPGERGGGGSGGSITTINNNATTNTATAQHHFDQQRNLCHGYGFTIYDCEPFDLEPRHGQEIRIAFTPDFTLTNTVVSLTIFTNVSESLRYALIATVPRDLLVACNHSLPRPEWETTMHYILAIGMVIMISCSIFMAYLEAKIYLKRERQSFQKRRDSSTSDKSLCSINNSQNGCSETNNNNNINNNVSHVDNQSDCNSLDNNSHSQQVTSGGQVSKKSNNRKGSVINEKSSLNNHSNLNKSGGSSSNAERRTKSDFSNAPIFKNLTNVIASPPPPLPSFDCDFNEFDFKKSKSAKKSTKKSNSLSGSIAGNDDTSSNGSQTNGSGAKSGKNNKNNNCQSQKTHNGGPRDGKSSSNRSANQSPSLQQQQQSSSNDIVNKASESQQLTNSFNNFKSISSTNQTTSKSSRSYSNGYSSTAMNNVQTHNPLSANGSKYWSNDMARFTGLVETISNGSVSPAQNAKYVPTTVPSSCSSVLDNELDHLRATSSPWNSSLSAIDQMIITPASVDRVPIASTKAPLRPCFEAFSKSDADSKRISSANVQSDLTHDGEQVPKLIGYNSAFSVPSGLACSPPNSTNGSTVSSAPTDQFNLFGPDSGPNWIGWVNRQKT